MLARTPSHFAQDFHIPTVRVPPVLTGAIVINEGYPPTRDISVRRAFWYQRRCYVTELEEGCNKLVYA